MTQSMATVRKPKSIIPGDDAVSMSSEWTTTPSVEQLSRKLLKTREQLKKAIERILTLKESDAITQQRLSALELNVAVMKSKSDGPPSDNESEESEDSIDKQLDKDDVQEDVKKDNPSGDDTVVEPKLIVVQSNVQGVLGGGLEPKRSYGPAEKGSGSPADHADPESDSSDYQHGIRAKVLDPSKIVHYRFEGKEKDYLQWSLMMTNYLEMYGLWTYVSGERPRPPGPSEPDFQRSGVDSVNYDRWVHWKKRDADYRNILQSNVHRDVLPIFTSCETSAEMWQVLKETF